MSILGRDVYWANDLARGPKPYLTRDLDRIDTIVVHHSATPPNSSPFAFAFYHVTTLHWPGIGYHVTISQNNAVWIVNDPHVVSYHVGYGPPLQGVSATNWRALGVCMVGNFTGGRVPDHTQLLRLREVVTDLRAWLNTLADSPKPLMLAGHKEISRDTQCPGDDHEKWLHPIRDELGLLPWEE